jgi:hypothetical protein
VDLNTVQPVLDRRAILAVLVVTSAQHVLDRGLIGANMHGQRRVLLEQLLRSERPKGRHLGDLRFERSSVSLSVRPLFVGAAVIPVEPADTIILQSNVIEVAQHRTLLGHINLGATPPTARRFSAPSSWSPRRLELVKVGGNIDPCPAVNAIEPVAVIEPRQRLLDELALLHDTIMPTAGDTYRPGAPRYCHRGVGGLGNGDKSRDRK